jgi:inositol phosphorylceramide mannosyltransferase catalytic subunit
MNTPTIIHQIWIGGKPVPPALAFYAKTWLTNHPKWSYELWDDKKSKLFIEEKHPFLSSLFSSLPYLTQKVDLLKYLLLFEFGGVYIDLDCECLKPLDELLTHSVCLGLEPRDEALHKEFTFFIGSALMSAIPKTPFFKATIDRCKQQVETMTPNIHKFSKYHYVMETTGPTLINRVYHSYEEKDKVMLLPPEIIGPFRSREATLYRENKLIGYGANKVANAYAIHHFMGSWL